MPKCNPVKNFLYEYWKVPFSKKRWHFLVLAFTSFHFVFFVAHYELSQPYGSWTKNKILHVRRQKGDKKIVTPDVKRFYIQGKCKLQGRIKSGVCDKWSVRRGVTGGAVLSWDVISCGGLCWEVVMRKWFNCHELDCDRLWWVWWKNWLRLWWLGMW